MVLCFFFVDFLSFMFVLLVVLVVVFFIIMVGMFIMKFINGGVVMLSLLLDVSDLMFFLNFFMVVFVFVIVFICYYNGKLFVFD